MKKVFFFSALVSLSSHFTAGAAPVNGPPAQGVGQGYIAPEFARGQLHPPMPKEMTSVKKKDTPPELAHLVQRKVTPKLAPGVTLKDGVLYLEKLKEPTKLEKDLKVTSEAKMVPELTNNQLDSVLGVLGTAGAPANPAEE